MDMKEQVVASTDDPASHLALIKVLQHKGVLTPEDMEMYYQQRIMAIKHITVISSVMALAVLIQEKEIDEEDFVDLVGELGLDLSTIKPHAAEALEYMCMSDEQKELVRTVVEQMPTADQCGNED